MTLNDSIHKSGRLQSLHRGLGIVIASAFTIWGMILRFKPFADRQLWIDEIIQINMTFDPLKPLWLRGAGVTDITSFPGDYLLTYPFVLLFGESKLVAIPHAIVSLLGFYLMYLLCRAYVKTPIGYLVAFVVLCFNDLLIFHAFEIRPYSVLPTLSLACLYFSKDMIRHKNNTDRRPIKYFSVIALFVITILFHPFGVAIAFFVLVFHLVNQLKEDSFSDVIHRNLKFIGTISAITIIPWIYFVVGIILVPPLEQEVFEFVPNPFSNSATVSDTMAVPNPSAASNPNTISNSDGSPGYLVFAGYLANHMISLRSLYLLFLGIIAAFILKQKDRYSQIVFLITLIILPIVSIFILDIAINYWFLPRQYTWVIALNAFFLGWCWDSIICSFHQRFKGTPE